MNPDDELKMLEGLVALAEQRIAELKPKPVPAPVQPSPSEVPENDFGAFNEAVKSLNWREGRKPTNSFVHSKEVPQEVKLYMMNKGKKETGGFIVWTKSAKYFLSDSGILGRDWREQK